ncbi:Brain protein [Apis cerana cerana]|uniref:Mitochondrial pyruvate carrier n=1 Tax=Apis cerana cerana TaxID=94128 RepID=A0A2A3E8Q9_APICC|nr:Brain protein [Apis cerana cerana]
MSVIYKNTMNSIGKFVPQKFQPLWNHPAVYKLQGLVIAGLGDLQRPASQISISQSTALGITGLIWTRYSLAITPKNWSLFSVNLFVALTALYQVSRGIMYQREQTTATASTKEK